MSPFTLNQVEIGGPSFWRVKLFRRWPFGRLRVRWYAEMEVPTDFDHAVRLTPPPIVYRNGDEIWLSNATSYPSRANMPQLLKRDRHPLIHTQGHPEESR